MNCLECGAQKGAMDGPFGHGSDEQVDVVHRVVEQLETFDNLFQTHILDSVTN